MNTNQLMSLLLIAAFVIGSGCTAVPRPSPQELAATEFGPAPSPEQIESEVKSYFQFRLRDPLSAQYQFGKPEKYFIRKRGEQAIYGAWRVYGNINAKNAYGAYIGFEQFGFLFRNGRIEQRRVVAFDVEDWKPVSQ